jgi:peptidoglycan/xylan/chitin deacetylase (PgdA/CDA1 family)
MGCVASALIWLVLAPSALAAPSTVVSLTFDDGNADQMQALPIMQQYGVNGTFYIISGVVGTPNYLTLDNLHTIADGGNEIAGHTVTHPDLTTVPSDEAIRQICNGRVTLTNWGFRVTSFAYPYAALNSAVETDVKNCGFNSARGLGDIASAHSEAGVTQLAESIPPKDPYDLAAVDEIDNTWTVAQMEDVVTKAEAQGGWIIFTIHHLCTGTGCDSLSMTPDDFASFVAWLKTQSTVSVKTVDSVIGGDVQPAVSGPPATPHGLVNPSLETPGTATPVPAADGSVTNTATASATIAFPECWTGAGWGDNTPTWANTTDAHSGTNAMNLNITGMTAGDPNSGDAKLLPTFDLGGCSPTVTPGTQYNLGTWYKSTGTTQFALYYRDSSGAWYYWTSSPYFVAASDWTQATWTTPAVPDGATGMSFGLALITNGSLTTDDYTMDAVPPTTTTTTTTTTTDTASTTTDSSATSTPAAVAPVPPTPVRPPVSTGPSKSVTAHKSTTTPANVVVQVNPVTVNLNRGTTATVTLKCNAAPGSRYCTGKLALTVKGQTVTNRFRIKARQTARIVVKLPRRALAAAAGKHHPTLYAKLKISTDQAHGAAKITRGALTIKTAPSRGKAPSTVPIPSGHGVKQGTRVAVPIPFGD